ncbi:MAG TPA: carboxypeptidase-like regulatory domain-containing protein [Terracidiphilus sp.]|nr:carboxypeptidase-like regulatory domain-containing protein [Terracidiphilus sp.]
MKRSAHLAGFAVLIALGAAPVCGAATASVSGIVRDSAGVPQIGVQVQLLRPDLSVISSVYTNGNGQFFIASLLPGRYALKAMGPSFLPSLRENVRVRRGTVVNLTLNTLYEVMQWLPAAPRAGDNQKDDWAWTLRSAANRPLLRWLEDGPLMVVTDGPGATPRLKARLMATGQAGTFGESGERYTATVEDTPADSRELLARVDFAPGSDAGMESMLGFRQDLGFAGSVQSVAAVAIHPEESDGSGDQGLDEAAVRSQETLHLGEAIEAEAGATEVLARIAGPSPDTLADGLPFAAVAWHDGNSGVHYRVATMVPDPNANDETEAAATLPQFSERGGELVFERGLHQEIGWERSSDSAGMAVLVFSDNVENPVLEAMSRFVSQDSVPALLDSPSGLLRAAGPAFASTGMEASVERRLPCETHVRLSYFNGAALVMPALPGPSGFTQILASAHSRRTQAYAISLSGTLDGTHTRWRASYRWQADDTVTAIAPFDLEAAEPYLSLHFRQPIHMTRDGSGGVEALLDVSNLLAEGYRPYILSDGSVLIFAQSQRALRGGLAFTF